jgi:ABC-2 type transport system ATP-binding protein
LDSPDRGRVLIDGHDLVEHPERVRRRIGWMPDHFESYRDMTVGDYLDFFGRAHGLKGAELRGRFCEVVDFTDLGPLLDRPMGRLSKGQTQRLCLARTLLNDPDFLILDEPAAGLDPKARLEFKNLVRLLRERGKTLLISSHILTELGEMCDTLIFMDAGRVVHHGDKESLLQRDAATGASVGVYNLTVHGPVDPLTQWLAVRPGWKLLETRRDGVRAEFSPAEPAAVSTELRRLAAEVALVEFAREERRLEEAFVDMLRAPAARPASAPPVMPLSAPPPLPVPGMPLPGQNISP